MYLGPRLATGALAAASFALCVGGTAAENIPTKMDLFAWAILIGMLAAVGAIWITIQHFTESASIKSPKATATAVGEVMGEVLDRHFPQANVRDLSRRRDI